jgi:hypothetical protein
MRVGNVQGERWGREEGEHRDGAARTLVFTWKVAARGQPSTSLPAPKAVDLSPLTSSASRQCTMFQLMHAALDVE